MGGDFSFVKVEIKWIFYFWDMIYGFSFYAFHNLLPLRPRVCVLSGNLFDYTSDIEADTSFHGHEVHMNHEVNMNHKRWESRKLLNLT